ncbi:MAG TPA: putative Ig domain-containing protein, partial [Gaiellales bacterium]|nr:putative Ig domain-containing protein [Gaiellales bacterium]
AAFSGGGQRVTLLDPGTLNVTAATAFSLPITGLDTDSRASTLAYHATGLPAGLSIAPVPHSTNAVISGTLPLTLSTFTVTVTATDSRTGRTGRVTFAIVVG